MRLKKIPKGLYMRKITLVCLECRKEIEHEMDLLHPKCPACDIPFVHTWELPVKPKDHSNDIYRLEQIILAVERLNHKCEDNMKRLNNMMLELKGLIAMVRPNAKKNAWYGTEIETEESKLKNKDVMSIELKDSE